MKLVAEDPKAANESEALADVMKSDARRCASGKKRFVRFPAQCEREQYFAATGQLLVAVKVDELSPGIRVRTFLEERQ